MLTFSLIKKPIHPKQRAQAMVEFAIVAPILFLMLFGIFEVGRMVFLYSAVTNASREAVRYGSAIGLDEYGEIKYKHCAGIREVARQASYITNLPDSDITITYDHGPGTAIFHTCTGTVDPGYFIKSGDRILVTISGQYTPYTRLVPWGSRSFVSSSARTVLGYVVLSTPVSGGGGGGGGSTNTPTATEDPYNPWTATPTDTEGPSPTPTITHTMTATAGAVFTFTPGVTPSSSPTLLPSNTPTATATRTNTPTGTATFTPTITSTAVPGCDQITTSPISINGRSMSMTITNPHDPVTVQDIQVVWNAATGGTGNPKTLTMQTVNLGSLMWTVSSSAGTLTIVPPSTVTIPGNNITSSMIFTFDKNYQTTNGNESITITLSTPGCEGVQIKRP